jgi:RNA polymerase sigma-70 factor (ECF subfamily)
MDDRLGPDAPTRSGVHLADDGAASRVLCGLPSRRPHFAPEKANATALRETFRKSPALTLTVLRAEFPSMSPVAKNLEPADASESDESLITGAAGGDADALARLYDRYAPVLLSAGQRLLGGRREAEDLLHDIFVEVWQQAGEYNPERGSVKSWLFLRLRSRGIDRLRLKSRKNVELGEQLIATTASDPGEDPSLSPDRAEVRRRLESLPPDQRVAIELAYFGGLSGAQIAAELGVPIGTIKTRLALGMSKLRAVFCESPEVAK